MSHHHALFTLMLVFVCALTNHAHAQSCGGVVLAKSAESGIITSPGYPDHYPEDLTCIWRIQAPLNEKIELQFWDFDVTGSDDCTGDYMGITSGTHDTQTNERRIEDTRGMKEREGEARGTEERREDDRGMNEKGEDTRGTKENRGEAMRTQEEAVVVGERYCGSKSPDVITSEGDTIVITFASNAKGSCRGFNATYTVKEERVTCGSTTSAMEFTFTSPSYPESVSNDSLQCTMTVDHGCDSPICQLRLDFDEFELQPPFWGECSYDRFYVESGLPLPSLCGTNNDTHMYINVEGRKKTDLTFMLQELEYYLYNCYDIYGNGHQKEGGGGEENQEGDQHKPTHTRRQKRNSEGEEEGMERQGSTTGPPPTTITTTTTTTTTTAVPTTTEGDVTVALYNYKDATLVSFPTRRAWNIRVTQIPCECPQARVPKAPVGCLQYHRGLTGEIKTFNYDGVKCYSEDRWCDFSAITHVSDCDIRVGYTGHYNNLDYSVCVEPESGFCGVQYQQVGTGGFSLTNITIFGNHLEATHPQVSDSGCMADYLWVPGANNDHGTHTYERFCGTKLGTSRKWGTVTSFSKPFNLRVVTDADEFSLEQDYMNRGFHLTYSQIPCQLSG
ncbi:hypothetical protein Pmani_026415 [Petrolisthes manimaculis]|uniref:CUB domain-containing protein n=1 Tax=Petrolisthes manimaculis TaxID=1843537 RepID=A0AAE1U053_9EUCA|nr:hypothetical protein Pmani_026415 [Petrolisthes manimaculis]